MMDTSTVLAASWLAPRSAASAPGALIISLDFELLWGLRDRPGVLDAYRENLLGVREVVPRLLDLFTEFDVGATWATVGCLFAESREELLASRPGLLPAYANASLRPEHEGLGAGEADDPLHFAPGLVEQIRRAERQEIATHTFYHYYCLEPGQSADTFAADLASARALAERRGIALRSIVFPRNQHNPAYDAVLRAAGIVCYRGTPRAWMYRPTSGSGDTRLRRGARLIDAHLATSGDLTIGWDELVDDGLVNVPASLFLRPATEGGRGLQPLRRRRIVASIEAAAWRRRIVHLWWHPHNFGRHLPENLAALRSVLEAFTRCRDAHGMRSLTMIEAAEIALQRKSEPR